MQEKHATVDTLFKIGKDAHDRGVLRSECPYRPGSARCGEWTQGWDAALKARFGRSEELDAKPDRVAKVKPKLVESSPEDGRILGDLPTER